MFKVLVGRRKRRLWSPLTVAVSITAHLIFLDLALGLSSGEAAQDAPPDPPLIWLPPIGPATPAPPSPPAPPQDEPRPTVGSTRQIEQPPVDPPPTIPPIDVEARPADPGEYSGIGVIGDSIGNRSPSGPTSPTGTPGGGGGGEGPYTADMVEELPSISNESEAQRTLRRSYPPLLRETGIEGRAVVQAIIDERGMVMPGSAVVISATHQAFGEAAVRAVERFRFRPARIDGRPVPVMIAIPVDWRLDGR